MKLFKLTDENGKTRGDTQWGDGVTHVATETGNQLCSRDVIHAYTDPLLAMMMNPIHANVQNPLLWEAEGEVVADDGTKVGCKALTTVCRIPVPGVTLEQRVRFGILCALELYKERSFVA